MFKTSEWVSPGHPDKVADYMMIFDCTAGLYSRAVLDAVQLGFAIW